MAKGMFWTCNYRVNHDYGEKCDCRQEIKVKKDLYANMFKFDKGTGQISFNIEKMKEKAM